MYYVWNADSWQGLYVRESDAIAIATQIGGSYGASVPQSTKDAQTARLAQEAIDKADRIQQITDKLTGMSAAQLNTYIDNNTGDLASARVYLKRLTLVVQALAIEVGK